MVFKYNLFGFDKDGFNKQGFDKMGYDRDGFDAQGYDRSGYNRQGFHKITGLDRDGYDMDGFNPSGFDRSGFDHFGFSHEGIDREGFDRDGYDCNGFDRSGFSRSGYDINGYDKFGYDQNGYDKNGFDREGYNQNGFNRSGFSRNGYDSNGYDRFGYDQNGYDKNGFDREGYNQNGFDRSGYDRTGFDAYGYDKNGLDINGFDTDGFDRNGYNKDGFDRTGFNIDGFDHNGFNIFGFDVDGFDQYGFDQNGYDRSGYNRDGFDKRGFDKSGFDHEGFNNQGFDRNGFDRNGFDRNGRDSAGYDRAGYDIAGFNRDGYDCDGYDRHGYNLDGRDRNGYDKDGFDSEGYDCYGFNADGKTDTGFDRSEFDADGFHILTGYNPFGFDREGFNINGINADGYGRDGFHVKTGLNKEGYDRDGFDAQGYNRLGYNRENRNIHGRTPQEEAHARLMTVVWVDRKGNREIPKQLDKPANWKQRDAGGFDSDGYNFFGYDREGFNRAGFNQKGIHKETGTHYNSAGFDAAGFDQNGFNSAGFNANGFDRHGYDCNGFNAAGFDCHGYNRYGFNAAGFDRSGYDQDGYSKKGVDRKGFTRDLICAKTGTRFDADGYDYQGYDCNGYDRHQIHRDGYHISASRFEKEDRHERVHFEYVEGLSTRNIHLLQSEVSHHEFRAPLNAFESNRDEFDPYEYAKDMGAYRRTEADLNNALKTWRSIWNQPFFARIDAKSQKGMYIGKHEIPGEVIDWADRICSLYYDYQMFIGNQDYGLELVRDFDIDNGTYHGFTDKYAAHITDQEHPLDSSDVITDERLLAVINAYKSEKRIHDIIATIQKNQYSIITDDPDAMLIVNGCAGSGKTMIMFHRLRYLLYNYAHVEPYIKPESSFLISPFGILNGESDELSAVLQLQKVNRLSINQFYIYIINTYNAAQKKKVIDYTALRLVSNNQVSDSILQVIYSTECVDNYSMRLSHLFHKKTSTDMLTFISKECAFLKDKLATFHICSGDGIDDLIVAVNSLWDSRCQYGKESKTLYEVYCEAQQELRTLSRENGREMLKQELAKTSKNPTTVRILNDLISQNRFCGATKMTKGSTAHIACSTKYLNNVFRLYANWKSDVIPNTSYQNPLEFFDAFESTSAQIQALKEYSENADRSYGNYAIKSICSELKKHLGLSVDAFFEWELFYYCVGEYLLFGELKDKKQYFFIDEYQDYSKSELEYFMKIFPTGVFNLFGDPKQCISIKGLKSESNLTFLSKQYQLNENYRNAFEITTRVNQEFAMNMLPIGIKGSVKSATSVDVSAKDVVNGDRIAVLFKSYSELEKNGIYEEDELFHFVKNSNSDIARDQINIIPIYYAKGLEFEKVYVLTHGMTNNERYVAMTRALNELIVI